MKAATPDHPVHELIAARWSPYGYASTPVSDDDLRSIFEAARWAPSSYNEQPWSYVMATQESRDEFERALSCLVEPNQAWAKSAPVLVLCITSRSFSRNGKPNAAAVHDLGLAAANICFEATVRGLFVHQMIGILPDRVRELYEVPDGHDPVTALTIGYAADPAPLPDQLRERDQSPRTRKPLPEFVFAGKWGQASALISRRPGARPSP